MVTRLVGSRVPRDRKRQGGFDETAAKLKQNLTGEGFTAK